MVVEVGKEDDEGDSVANQSPLHPLRERTARVEGLGSMTDCHMELDLLNTQHSCTKLCSFKKKTLRKIVKRSTMILQNIKHAVPSTTIAILFL